MRIALWLLPLLIVTGAGSPMPTLVITVRHTAPGHVSESVEYRQADRQRIELRGSGPSTSNERRTVAITITRCDLGKQFSLIPETRTSAAQIMTVLASAIGPLLLAVCVRSTGSYAVAAGVLPCLNAQVRPSVDR